MVKIIMHGCNGKMGQVITGIVAEDENAEIVAGIDIVDNRENGYPVFTKIDECNVEADVLIDFSSAVAVDPLFFVLQVFLKSRLQMFTSWQRKSRY